MSVPTPTELRATLVTVIASATETRVGRWETLIGKVEVLPIAVHPRCNWRVEVSGGVDDSQVVDAAIELLKGEHPYVRREESPGG